MGHRGTRRLLAIAQRGIKNQYTVLVGHFRESFFTLAGPGAAKLSGGPETRSAQRKKEKTAETHGKTRADLRVPGGGDVSHPSHGAEYKTALTGLKRQKLTLR